MHGADREVDVPSLANHEVSNWFGSIVSHPRKRVRPISVDQIQTVVKETGLYPSPLRAVGSNHSTTECGVADGGTLIEMGGMNEIRIDREAMTVTAGAGALYVDVAEALSAEGLQLFVNPEIGSLSIGSASCGGTKDASMPNEYPQVSSYCIEMKIVNAAGELETIDDPKRLQIMRSSYGLLGIVYEATFRVKPLRPLVFSHVSRSIDEFAEQFDDIRRDDRSMMFYVMPFLNRIVVEYREEGEGYTPSALDRAKWRFRNWVWEHMAPAWGRVWSFLVPVKTVRYALIDVFNWLVVMMLVHVLHGKATDPSDQVIRYSEKGGIGKYTFSIWAFDEKDFCRTLIEYRNFCRAYYVRHGYRCNMLNVGYRFAPDKGSLLSYSFDGPKWSLDIVSTGDPGWDRLVWSYNHFCSERGGKPLFNQTRSITPSQVKKAFSTPIDEARPEGATLLDLFEAERRRADPEDRFLNRYFAWLLSLAEPSAVGADAAAKSDDLGEERPDPL